MRLSSVAALVLATGCVNTREVAASLASTESALASIDVQLVRACAPAELARAEAHLALARHVSRSGDPRRVSDHAELADQAWAAVEAQLAACPQAQDSGPGTDAIAADCEIPEGYDGPLDDQGCPDGDRDGDGIPDSRDRCPDEPEDIDGWEDEDGCPDPDNDGDGVLDEDDDCPDVPGDPAFAGCPAPSCEGPDLTVEILLDPDLCASHAPRGLRLDGERLLLDRSPTIGADGQLSIDRMGLQPLVELLRKVPGLTLEIQAHLSSQEDAAMSTSQRYADQIAETLRSLGAPASRIEAVGFGDQSPIDTNRTESGRQRNRRIELYAR